MCSEDNATQRVPTTDVKYPRANKRRMKDVYREDSTTSLTLQASEVNSSRRRVK
jgi:hypothetical protein